MRVFALMTLLLSVAAMVPNVAAADPPVTLTPPVGAAPTTLYFHLIGYEDFPINTQMPDDNYTVSPVHGFTSLTTTCTNPTPSGFVGQTEHTFYGYSSPSIVEYNVQEHGKPRIHTERGLSYDVKIDPATPWTLSWFLETQISPTGGAADPNMVPAPVPNVVVAATVRGGDQLGVGHASMETGEVLAKARTDPIHLAGPASDTVNAGRNGYVATTQVGDKWVTEFRVTFADHAPILPKETGYNVRVDVLIDNPVCSDPATTGYFMPALVRVHSSAGHRPLMALGVLDAVRIVYMHPEFVGDEMVIHTGVNSPWGSYDVDSQPGGVELHIRGGAFGSQDPPHLNRTRFIADIRGHNNHTAAAMLSYVWDYQADHASGGVYKVTMSVQNSQHTAVATGTTSFELGKVNSPGLGRASPGTAALGVVGAVGLAALVARRRHG